MAPHAVIRVRRIALTLLAAGGAAIAACHEDAVGPVWLEVAAGNGQTAAQWELLPQPLVVRVLDAAGAGRAGVGVAFRTRSGHGWIGPDSATTDSIVLSDAAGLASVGWRLGGVEAETLDVTVSGSPSSLTFTATALQVVFDLVTIAGDGQTALAGATLPLPVRARLQNGQGIAIAGTALTFTVTGGGGSITDSTPATDANGVATLGSWTLGSTPGENRLTVRAVGTSAEFTATGRAPTAPASITIVAGDNQTAPPDSVVAVPPAARVDDGTGAPMAGVAVSFQVIAGGGTVTPDTVRTNASGIATTTSWRMGPSVASNALLVTVAGVTPDTIIAFGRRETGTIGIGAATPQRVEVREDVLGIPVRVNSTYQLASLGYTAFGISGTLTYAPNCSPSPCWFASVSAASVPYGYHDVVVTATDVFNNVEDAVFRVLVDRPPRLIIAEPLPGTIATPDVRIIAECVDDGPQGCTDFQVLIPSRSIVISQGVNQVNTSYSLAAFAGSTAAIRFYARDARGNEASIMRDVAVLATNRLALEVTAAGLALDYDGTRTLHADASNVLRILSGATDSRLDSLTAPILAAALTPQGALASLDLGSNTYRLFTWQGGPATDLGLVVIGRFATAGGNAAWTDGSGALRLRNPGSGSAAIVAVLPGGGGFDVTAGGAVYFSGYDPATRGVLRYANGSTTMLPSDTALDHHEPLTDGARVVYSRSPRGQVNPRTILLNDGATEIELAPPTSTFIVTRGQHYQVNNGWVAFVVQDGLNRPQVWTRTPGGALRQISFFSTPSSIEALGDDGSVVFRNAEQGRYYAPASGSTTDIGTLLGNVVWRGGRYYALIGRHVFRVVP